MSSTTETKLGTPAGAAARVATKRMRLLVTGGPASSDGRSYRWPAPSGTR